MFLCAYPQSLLRRCIEERLAPVSLRKVFAQVCRGWSDFKAATRSSSSSGPSTPSAAVLSPEEVSEHVLRWHLKRRQELPAGMVSLQLHAAVTEFMAAVAAAGLPLPADLRACQLDSMSCVGLPAQLTMSVYCCADRPVHPPATSPPTGSAKASSRAPTLGEDHFDAVDDSLLAAGASFASGLRLSRIAVREAPSGDQAAAAAEAAEVLVRRLLAEGRVLGGARAARRLRVAAVHPRELLRAAADRGDEAAFASVYRCFRDALLPSFPGLDAARAQMMMPPPPLGGVGV